MRHWYLAIVVTPVSTGKEREADGRPREKKAAVFEEGVSGRSVGRKVHAAGRGRWTRDGEEGGCVWRGR